MKLTSQPTIRYTMTVGMVGFSAIKPMATLAVYASSTREAQQVANRMLRNMVARGTPSESERRLT